MHRFTHVLAPLAFALSLAACGGGNSGYIIPIETELKPWVAPEAEELVAEEDEGEEEEFEDYEDEEEEAEAAPAAAPATK